MKTTPSPQPMTARSPLLRFARWLFSWRILRRLVLGTAALITLLALAVAFENWRSRRAWEHYKAQGEARGEHYSLASLATPTLPDDQNFAATPFLKPLFGKETDPATGVVRWHDTNGVIRALTAAAWLSSSRASLGRWDEAQPTDLQRWQQGFLSLTNALNVPAVPVATSVTLAPPRLPAHPGDPAQDVLAILDQLRPVTDELTTALQRPSARYNLGLERGLNDSFVHLGALRQFQTLLVLRALAELAADRTEDAFIHTEAAIRLAETLRDEPFLISSLVRFALLRLALQPIWEGCIRHAWNDHQLTQFQEQLASIDLLADLPHAARGERALAIDFLRQLREGLPPGQFDDAADAVIPWRPLAGFVPAFFTYRNQLALAKFYDQQVLGAVDPAHHRLAADRVARLGHPAKAGDGPALSPFVQPLLPAWDSAILRFAQTQAYVDLAIVATGLERYRLAHGRYPDSLEAMVPGYLARLPRDVITGEPLHYRPGPEGGYVLYAVGGNQKDDGGTLAYRPSLTKRLDEKAGDWVWRQP